MKHSDAIALLLKERKFTHFFFVGGGNIMHLIGSLSKFLQPIPVIHEVAAIIGSEYFNKALSKYQSLRMDLMCQIFPAPWQILEQLRRSEDYE